MTVNELRAIIDKVRSIENPRQEWADGGGCRTLAWCSFEECRKEIIQILIEELAGMFPRLLAEQEYADRVLKELQ